MPGGKFQLPFRSRRRIAADLEAEFAFHIERRTAELVAGGAAPGAARAQAVREFGDATEARAYCGAQDRARERAARRADWLADAAHDLRHALRQLRRQPAFAATAVLTLALGIGANAAIFALVDQLVLRPLPYPDAGRLVAVLQTDRGQSEPSEQISYGDFHALRAEGRPFDRFAVLLRTGITITGGGPADRVAGAAVSADFFPLLGARTALGRTFAPDETQGEGAPVVVLSDAYWRSRFAGDSAAVGRTIVINGGRSVVVGVLAPGVDLAYPGTGTALYLPLPEAGRIDNRGFYGYYAIARRAPGVSLRQAGAALAAAGARFAQAYPESNAGRSFAARPLHEAILGPTRTTLLALLGAATFVLLIAAVNLANLLVARHLAREREFAVRVALGASRGRLLRQVLLEVQALTVLGALAGLALAALGLKLVTALGWPDALTAARLTLDWRVAGVAALAAAVCGGACALAAALPARDRRLAALRSGTRDTGGAAPRRVRRVLVATETALAFVLLAGAGLMLATVRAALRSDPGFDGRGLYAIRVAPPQTRFTSLADAADYFDRLAADLRTIPGVRGVALTNQVPFSGDRSGTAFIRPEIALPPGASPPTVNYQVVTPGFFATMGIAVVRGREFAVTDRAALPHRVIVSDELARRYFPGEDPIGRMVRLGPASVTDLHEIIGVVHGIRHLGVTDGPLSGVYDLYGQHGGRAMGLLLRSDLAPAQLLTVVRAHLARFDADAPLYSAASMDEMARRSIADQRTVLTLLLVFAGIALALAVVGIYGVIAQTVRARLKEYGIRIALGAPPWKVRAGILGGGLGLGAAGALGGAAIAAGVTRVLRGLLFGVAPLDVRVFGAALVLLLAAALASAVGPARRAAGVDLAGLLREE